MKLKNWLGLALVLGLLGCSNDDEGLGNTQESSNASFTVIGEDLNTVYLLSYDGNAQPITSDLTQELLVPSDYLTLRQRGNTLSFYSFSQGFFSLAVKDVETGTAEIYEDFYLNTPERSVSWGIDDQENVFFGYYGPNGSRNLGLQDFDLTNSTSLDIQIDFNVDTTYQPLLYENRVYISYKDNTGVYKLTYYDIATKVLGPQLTSNTRPFGFLITQNGELALLKGLPTPVIEFYDAQSFSFLEETSLERDFGFPAGPVNDVFVIEDRLYFNFIYPQPSRFISGPAIYDLVTQELNLIDISTLVDDVEEEIGFGIIFTTQVYDATQDVFLMGYGSSGDEVLGGVIAASSNGDLLENVTFPFFPTYFVRN